jgi:predicted transcriptional regulator
MGRPKKYDRRIVIPLESDTIAELERLAEQYATTTTQIARRAIEHFVTRGEL